MIALKEYDQLISLREPYHRCVQPGIAETSVDTILDSFHTNSHGLSYQQKRMRAYELITFWHPETKLRREVKQAFNALLSQELSEQYITDAAALALINKQIDTQYPSADRCIVWRGDITKLKIDAIVNAANAQMLGCFIPGHKCIDNAIHAAGGPQRREDFHAIMKLQGRLEETGTAKITRAYNLPSDFVLHTVGPIVRHGTPSAINARFLSACYTSCLNLAAETGMIRSIAFCSISTGVFGYAPEQAAKVALSTVNDWLTKHVKTLDRVVFNVFSEKDFDIYTELLKNWKE